MQFHHISQLAKKISFSLLSAASALLLTSPSCAILSVPQNPLPFKVHLPAHPDPSTEFTAGRLLVHLKPGVDSDAFLNDVGLKRLDRLPEIGVEVVEVPEGQEKEFAGLLNARNEVDYAEVDYVYHTFSIPNDPYFSKYQWNMSKINLPEAWNQTTGSQNVTVAVLDTGVDTRHPDLASKLVAGYNAVDGTSDVTDDEGHGTHVSGLLGAIGNNGKGIAGVSWGSRIMPVKVLDADGSGSTVAIAHGIDWAADHGAKILNMSLGGPGASRSMGSAVNYAIRKGCLIVVAAGNEYEDGNPVEYPAAYPGVVAVAATNDSDGRASYSSVASYVSLAAPGGDPTSSRDNNDNHWILSTWPTYLDSETGYEAVAGTSQATPIVSGLAALIWSLKPDYTADQVKEVIEKTAVDLGAPGKDNETGYGRVDANAAVAYVLAGSASTPSTGGTSTGTTGGNGGDTTVPITSTLTQGDLNGDGKINVSDATLALRIAAGLVTPSAGQLKAGDVAPAGQPDGRITVTDATRLLRITAGLDTL
jgi:subtilisin family serine protease